LTLFLHMVHAICVLSKLLFLPELILACFCAFVSAQ